MDRHGRRREHRRTAATATHTYQSIHLNPPPPPKKNSSAQFDDFLNLTDRIARIKAMGSGFVSCPCPPPPSEGAEGEGEWAMVASELSAAGKAGV